MTRFIALASAAMLMVALTGCGAEPAQKNEAAPEFGKVPILESAAKVEAVPPAEETPITPNTAAATEATKRPDISRPSTEPKAPVPPQAKPVPEAPKSVEPDPHAGHDLD